MTLSALRGLTRKVLAARARKNQIAGWHQMTKDELVVALAARRRRRAGGGSTRTRLNGGTPLGSNGRADLVPSSKTAQRRLAAVI